MFNSLIRSFCTEIPFFASCGQNNIIASKKAEILDTPGVYSTLKHKMYQQEEHRHKYLVISYRRKIENCRNRFTLKEIFVLYRTFNSLFATLNAKNVFMWRKFDTPKFNSRNRAVLGLV